MLRRGSADPKRQVYNRRTSSQHERSATPTNCILFHPNPAGAPLEAVGSIQFLTPGSSHSSLLSSAARVFLASETRVSCVIRGFAHTSSMGLDQKQDLDQLQEPMAARFRGAHGTHSRSDPCLQGVWAPTFALCVLFGPHQNPHGPLRPPS